MNGGCSSLADAACLCHRVSHVGPCLQVDINSSVQHGSHQHARCVCMPLLSRPMQRRPAARVALLHW